MSIESVNIVAVLVGALGAFAFGAVWYGPLLGEPWMRAVGLNPEEVKPTPMPFVIAGLAALTTSVTIAVVMSSLNIDTAMGGGLTGVLLGLGLIAPALASDNAFCNWGLPLFLIQAGYRVISCGLIGVINGLF